MKRLSRRERNDAGFTLIELMIVVAIIAVLAILAVVGYRAVVNSSRTAEPRQFVMSIRLAQESYKAETGTYASISASKADLCPLNAGTDRLKHGWTPTCGGGANPQWNTISATPDGPVLFGYATMADPSCPNLPPITVGATTMPPAFATGPCYWIYAYADLNGDGTKSEVLGTSLSKDLTVIEQQ